MDTRAIDPVNFKFYMGGKKIEITSLKVFHGRITVQRNMVGDLFFRMYKENHKVTLTLVPCYYIEGETHETEMSPLEFGECSIENYFVKFGEQEVDRTETIIFKMLRFNPNETNF